MSSSCNSIKDKGYTDFRILCFFMQGVWWFRRTCLLAVQNFFWKNSSFIWMPTAERGTTHTQTWWQGTFMFGALKSVICITKDIIPRARREGGSGGGREITTQTPCASFINPNWGNTSTFIAANRCWRKWAKKAITPRVKLTRQLSYLRG